MTLAKPKLITSIGFKCSQNPFYSSSISAKSKYLVKIFFSQNFEKKTSKNDAEEYEKLLKNNIETVCHKSRRIE